MEPGEAELVAKWLDDFEAKAKRMADDSFGVAGVGQELQVIAALRGILASAKRSEKLAAWLEWCLDNCDDSPYWNFGTEAAEHMRTLLAGGDAPMPKA